MPSGFAAGVTGFSFFFFFFFVIIVIISYLAIMVSMYSCQVFSCFAMGNHSFRIAHALCSSSDYKVLTSRVSQNFIGDSIRRYLIPVDFEGSCSLLWHSSIHIPRGVH